MPSLSCHLNPSDPQPVPTMERSRGTTTPPQTVQQAVLYHANQNPEALAVRDLSQKPGRALTYAQLVRHSRKIAIRLQQAGVRPNARVPLIAHRSIEMLVGILGILLAGGLYVPLDGGVVAEKTLQSVLLSSVDVVLATSIKADRVRSLASQTHTTLVLEEIMGEDSEEDESQPAMAWRKAAGTTSTIDANKSNMESYVMDSALTAGLFNGVDANYANLAHGLCNAPGNVGMQPGLRVGSVLPASFDASLWIYLLPLCSGCTLVLRGRDWAVTLREIDILISIPTIVSGFVPCSYPNIKTVAVIGGRLPTRIADDWTNAGKRLISNFDTTRNITGTTSLPPIAVETPVKRPTSHNSKPVPENDGFSILGDTVGQSCGHNFAGWTVPPQFSTSQEEGQSAITGTCTTNLGDVKIEKIASQPVISQVKGKCATPIKSDHIISVLRSVSTVSDIAALMIEDRYCIVIARKSCDIDLVRHQIKLLLPDCVVPVYFHALDHSRKQAKYALSLAEDASNHHGCVPSMAASQDILSNSPSHPSIQPRQLPQPVPADNGNINSSSSSESDYLDLPEKSCGKLARGLRYRILIVYRALFSLVWVTNIASLIVLITVGIDRKWLIRLAYINLTISVLVRQDHVVNLLYAITCSVPKTWPLWIRRRCAKVYHLGGIHSGTSSAATAWYISALGYMTWIKVKRPERLYERPSVAALVVSWIVVPLFLGIIATSIPSFRKAHHNAFELVHRFVGWAVFMLLWAQTFLFIHDAHHSHPSKSLGQLVARSPEFWLLAIMTTSIIASWMTLRKVDVDPEVLSGHAVRLHFNHIVPYDGTFIRVSRRPLIEWHSFATVPAPNPIENHPPGFSLFISNAGDWTRRMIESPPRTLWVRGIPTGGVMRIATLFKRIVIVGTGSGIGPLLGFIQHPSSPFRLIWSTKTPETTFGSNVCSMIRQMDPHAVIYDTSVQGRPDLVALAWREAKSFDADAVIVIANEKLTRKVVYGMETRGIAAFGAIWDS